MTENEMLAGDLLTACSLLAAEKELTDDLAAFVAAPIRAGVVIQDGVTYTILHVTDQDWIAERESLLARYREARER